MKKTVLYFMLLAMPILASAQDNKYQVRIGWGGYPVTEMFLYGISWCDCGPSDISLFDIYWDSNGPIYTTGSMSAEFSWLLKDWFTVSLTGAVNLTWQNSFDAVTGKRTGTEYGGVAYLMPECRFNWLRKDLVKMYSSVGVGVMVCPEFYYYVLPAGQISPVGIEVGKKVYGFCELGIGLMYTGAKAGIGFRF